MMDWLFYILAKFLVWLRFCANCFLCIFKSRNYSLAFVPVTEKQYSILLSIASDLDISIHEAVFHVWNRNFDAFGFCEASIDDSGNLKMKE